MEMLQLRYFYESAITESFSKVAQKYMVPVSSVSASIKRLENELGVPLFIRTGNRILLSEKGKEFLFSVKNFLTELDNGINSITAEKASGSLSFLVLDTRETIVRRILKFHQLYPSISYKIDLNYDQRNLDNYDIIVSEPNEIFSDYECVPLINFAIRIEALATDPLCERKLTLNQLRNRYFVTTDTQNNLFKIFTHACEQRGFTPKVLLECNDYSCRDLCLLSGSCLGLTLGNTTNSPLPNVQYLDITDFDERLKSNLYFKKEAYHGNIKLFIDFIKSQ